VQTIVEQKEKPVSDYAWAHLFAHPDSFLCLEVLAARLTEKERILFLQSYRERYENLLPFIKRIRDKKPLISALDLQQRGIKPGKKMGLLLQEAERLSVETKTENADFILEALLHTPLWNIPE
jgi:poly(A) polymerase